MVLCPITSSDFKKVTAANARFFARKDTEIEVVNIEHGPESIESAYESAMAEPYALERIKDAEARGFDGVAISCMCDCGLHGGRELVKIPVASACESSILLASALGSKFSMITISGGGVGLIHKLVVQSGLESRLASIRPVDIHVVDLNKDAQKTKDALLKEAREAIQKDGAQVIVLACTGMTGMAHYLQQQLGVPVIDPLGASIKMAETMVDLNLSQSKLAYPTPSQIALLAH
jgi:allantoin racemase